MGKLNKAVRLLLVTILVFSMVVTCCGCKNTDTDGNGKDVVVSPVVEPSKEETKETAETVETEKPAETVEPVATEEPAEPEKPVELTGDYLKEMAQEEVWEFKLSDYNADFVAGNLVTITMVIESAGEFNGTLGTCIGTAYAWEQTEFSSQAGEYTVEWKIQPSVDMAQLGLWYAESGSVGVKSVDVAIEEVEVALEGDYIKVLQMGDNWEMKLSDYNSEYKVGDYVNIEITMESDGDFNGAVGACVGKDYAWQQKEYKYDTAGTYTFSWKVKPSTDMAQIGVWWTGGTGVGITKVKVTKEEQPIGISGDFIELFTEQGYYEFSPYVVSDYIFKFGDTIKVTVELESDGAFNGCMATCVGDNYAWEQTEMSGESGTTTWTMTVAPSADLIQVAVWWIDGSAVGIKSIRVEVVKWGYQHEQIIGNVYTASKSGDSYSFKPADYCDFEDGDVITVDVTLRSNRIFNGSMALWNADASKQKSMVKYEAGSGTITTSLVYYADKTDVVKIEFWWMNTKVAVDSIVVTKGGTVPVDEPGTWTIVGSTQSFYLPDYGTYNAGDKIQVDATFSSDKNYNGALVWQNGGWAQADFTCEEGGTTTATMVIDNAVLGNIDITMWWIGGEKVTLDELKVTVLADDGTGDDGDGDGEDETPTNPDVDPNAAYSGCIAFSDSSWWTQKLFSDTDAAANYPFTDIIGDVNPADITAIKFTSDTAFIVGYNNTAGSWSQIPGAEATNSYTFTDIAVESFVGDDSTTHDPAVALVLSKGDGVNYTISWNVYTGEVPEDEEDNDASLVINNGDTSIQNEYGVYVLKINPAYYCEGYTSLDDISIKVDLLSDGDFNGNLGMCRTENWSWVAASDSNLTGTAGTTATWTMDVEDSIGDFQIQIYYMGGESVEITNIEVTKTNADDGTGDDTTGDDTTGDDTTGDDTTGDDTTALFTVTMEEAGNYNSGKDFTVTDFCEEFVEGDTISVTVNMTSTADYFNGTIGANDAAGEWSQAEQQVGGTGSTTWTHELTNASNTFSVQFWWVNAGTVTIDSIEVEVVTDDTTGDDTTGDDTTGDDTTGDDTTGDDTTALFTVTMEEAGNYNSGKDFTVTDFCEEFVEGDTISVTVNMTSTADYFNGTIGGNDAAGEWAQAEQQVGGTGSTTWTHELTNASNTFSVQFWWINAGTITIDSIEVEVVTDDTTGDDTTGDDTTEEETTVGYAAVLEKSGTDYLTTSTALTGSSWGSTWVTSFSTDFSDDDYFVVTYSGTTPVMVMQGEGSIWSQTKAAYVNASGNMAAYSYSAMKANYVSAGGDLATATGIQVQANGADVTVSNVKLVEYSNVTSDYEAIVSKTGTDYITTSTDLAGASWGSSWITSYSADFSDNDHFVVTYSGTTPVIVLQADGVWSSSAPVYVNATGTVAVYNMASMRAKFVSDGGELSNASGVQIQANGADVTITNVKYVK